MNKKLLLENLDKNNNVILYFNSGGCGSCKQAKPFVTKIAESKKGYTYASITEGDESSDELGKFCGIEFYPTLVIIENNTVNRYVGLSEIKTL
jgi:thiol-disulfide isomerase/thioredoxin